jgi:hypothetical protein
MAGLNSITKLYLCYILATDTMYATVLDIHVIPFVVFCFVFVFVLNCCGKSKSAAAYNYSGPIYEDDA